MIMIMGETRDDILYFDSVLSHKRKEKILDRYEITFGTIFNQDILLIDGISSNELSSAMALYLIEKYLVILVFMVGKCVSVFPDFKPGEIAVSRKIMLGDADRTRRLRSGLGQIPGFENLHSQNDVIDYVRSSLEKRAETGFRTGKFVSFDREYFSREELQERFLGDSFYGSRQRVLLDCNTAGAALAGEISRVPFISVKVVERVLGEEYTIENYAEVLRRYIDLGKSMVTCIGDIGRTDLLVQGGDSL